MGGIHATMCFGEAAGRVDAVVTGEAESVWREVLEDCANGSLKPSYPGLRIDLNLSSAGPLLFVCIIYSHDIEVFPRHKHSSI